MLHWVCALGDLEKANAVLSLGGMEVNAQDNAGWTSLMIAGILFISSTNISSICRKGGHCRTIDGNSNYRRTHSKSKRRHSPVSAALIELTTRHYAASKNRIRVLLYGELSNHSRRNY